MLVCDNCGEEISVETYIENNGECPVCEAGIVYLTATWDTYSPGLVLEN